MNGYYTGLNGMLYISREDFENPQFQKDAKTVYLIHDINQFAIALGNLRIPFFNILTQAEYDALESPDENTLYIIRKDESV